MRKCLLWMIHRPARGDTPDPIASICLSAIGFAGSAIVYFRFVSYARWFLAYGLLWIGVLGIARLWESLRGDDGRLVTALIEGAFLLTYCSAGLSLTPLTSLAELTGWRALAADVGLLIGAVAGGVLIVATLAERYARKG